MTELRFSQQWLWRANYHLGCDVMKYYRSLMTFRKDVLHASSGSIIQASKCSNIRCNFASCLLPFFDPEDESSIISETLGSSTLWSADSLQDRLLVFNFGPEWQLSQRTDWSHYSSFETATGYGLNGRITELRLPAWASDYLCNEIYKCEKGKLCNWNGNMVGWLVYSCYSHSEHGASVKRFVSLQFLNVRYSVGLLGRVISPSQGLYLTQTRNKHNQISMILVGFEPTIPLIESEDSSCLRQHDHCVRRKANIDEGK
jgi:hypothetical protein